MLLRLYLNYPPEAAFVLLKTGSLVPALLTPIVMWLIFNTGSDKTATMIIPWVIFCLLYFLIFNLLAKNIRSVAVLAIVTTGLALLAAYAASILALYFVMPLFGT